MPSIFLMIYVYTVKPCSGFFDHFKIGIFDVYKISLILRHILSCIDKLFFRNSKSAQQNQKLWKIPANIKNADCNDQKNCSNFFNTFYLFIFIFTHNQLEINHSAHRNKDCE